MGRYGLGQFEQDVLLAVHHLHGKGYAVTIAGDLETRLQKSVSLGAIYATLDRLEKKGFVISELGESTRERGGKPKRFYQVTAPGVLALSSAREVDRRRWSGVPTLEAPI